MPEIGGLNVQVNQNQNMVSGARPEAGQAAQAAPSQPALPGVRTGTLVTGQVLSQNEDGTYSVRLEGMPQNLKARATVSLIVGERFNAVWDASGSDGVPVLRLSQGELSFLSQIPQRDRGLATALLARGLPLSNDVMAAIKDAWRRAGMQEDQLSSFIELWARDVPMTGENASLLAEYAALSGSSVTAYWNKIRQEIRERAKKGQNPMSALRDMKAGTDGVARFLQAHSIMMHAPRQDVNPVLLGAPQWPLPEGSEGMTARVFVGRSAEEDGQRYWQVGFGFEGVTLGDVGGLIESDGRACNLTLTAEQAATCDLLAARRGEIRAELEGSELPVVYIGISHRAAGGTGGALWRGAAGTPWRGLDLTV